MNVRLRVWRQPDRSSRGHFVEYPAEGISEDASFLEMLDIVNAGLERAGQEPIVFDSDCREGICGTCSLMINGIAHGPDRKTTVCQLHMRSFADGATITIEPWRARPFPVVKDLVVDRSALDRLLQAGGYVSVRTGSAPDAAALPVPKPDAEWAMDGAACIGCGACVAACPNASPMLFIGARVGQLAVLPQGQPERTARVLDMMRAAEREGFGGCTNHYECEAVCPAGVSAGFIAQLNREFARATCKTFLARR